MTTPADSDRDLASQIAGAATVPAIAMTPSKAAEATGLSRTRLFRAIKDNELTARKAGRATVIEAAELARFVASLPHRGRPPEDAT